jgi:hypothetical protein
MSLRNAIHEAERHIPGYHIPTEILGSRTLSRLYQDPSLFEFSRYHYGMMKSYANMARDLFGPASKNALGESRRIEAIGNLMATGLLMTVVSPGVNWLSQKMTGNDKLRFNLRGSETLLGPLVDWGVHKMSLTDWGKQHVPKYLADYYNGDADWFVMLGNLVPLAPVPRMGAELLADREQFTGKSIAEPADRRDAPVRAVGQVADWAARNLVQPYDMAARAAKGDRGIVRSAVESGFGFSEPNRQGRTGLIRHQEREARNRRKRPRGLLEEGGDYLAERLPSWLGGAH